MTELSSPSVIWNTLPSSAATISGPLVYFTVRAGESIDAALDSAEGNGGGTVYLDTGTHSYSTSPNFARPGVSILCAAGAILNHTGTGNAFVLDGGETGSGILGNRYENITVQGNANSTNGWYVRSMHHCTFINARCRGCAVTGSAFLLEWCVANVWITPSCSVNSGPLSPIPKFGMTLTRRGTGLDHTTTQTILNPIFEGITQTDGAGINILFAAKNDFVGGTSESNTNGMIITGDSGIGNNTFRSIFMEDNAVADIQLQPGAVYNAFYDITSSGLTDLQGNAGYNRFTGGVLANTTLGASTNYNRFRDVIFASGSTLTNNSQTTMFFDCVGAGGPLIINRSLHTLVHFSEVQEAGPSQDGKIIVENAGVGAKNIIVYSNSERVRYSGGSTF